MRVLSVVLAAPSGERRAAENLDGVVERRQAVAAHGSRQWVTAR
jgi:hypothetical protein